MGRVKSYFVMTWFKETTWIFVYMHGDLKTEQYVKF